MVGESEFCDGGGCGKRNEWLRMIDKDSLWGYRQKTVVKGTKLYASGKKQPWRVTTDNSLLFVSKNGVWRFYGVMGD